MIKFKQTVLRSISSRLKYLTAFSIFLLCLPRVVEAACVCGYDDGRFTTTTITIDGTMNDWSSVVADPDNNSCDDQGTGSPSADRDYQVQSTGRDLIRFAYTWDNNNIYTYTERAGSQNNTINFIYYADTDNDGLMEGTDTVFVAAWQGNQGYVELDQYSYSPVNSNGDSLVDAQGYADGYVPPGSIAYVRSLDTGYWAVPKGSIMEWSVPWTVLGIPAGTAFTFHVSSTNATPGSGSYPSQVDDNMGGCGGGPASAQYADLTLTPDQVLQTSPGTTVYAHHELTNTGNGADTFELTSTATGDFAPASIDYYLDLGTVGQYDDGTDILLTDTDGDGFVDSGVLDAGQSVDLLMSYDVPAGADGSVDVVTTATSSFDTNINATVMDEIRALSPNLTVIKSASGPTAAPGDVVTYTVTVLNAGSAEATNVVIDDHMSPYTAWQINYTDTSGGPFSFSPGSSGLSFDSADTDFSNDDGVNWGITPTSEGGDAPSGYDGTITNWKIIMQGDMAPGSQFTLRYKVKIK